MRLPGCVDQQEVAGALSDEAQPGHNATELAVDRHVDGVKVLQRYVELPNEDVGRDGRDFGPCAIELQEPAYDRGARRRSIPDP